MAALPICHQGGCFMSAAKSAILSAAIPLALALAAPAQAQLLSHKDLSYDMALTIATGALQDCKAKGYKVSVVVVDRDGIDIVTLRGDGAGPHTMENARRKAYTALTFKMTSEQFAKEFDTRPVRRQQATLPGVIGIPGGVPIKVGNEVIAGVGLSGSPGVDEPCVRAGIAKVEDQLK
jgi:uncharacterized protein GlcG (DUF336 family)